MTSIAIETRTVLPGPCIKVAGMSENPAGVVSSGSTMQ